MSHLLRLPVGGAYSTTVTLHPAYVHAHEERIEPVQRVLEASDGSHWVYQVSTNLRQTIELEIRNLPENDFSGFSGFNTLKTFFTSSVTWSLNPFDFTHDDGPTFTVRLVSAWQFTETLKERWTGTLTLRKYL